MRYIVGKFEFTPADIVNISLPVGAKPMVFNHQNGRCFLWAQIDADEACIQVRSFRMAGTGHTLEQVEKLTYINTMFANSFVWHFFEICQP